jgi:protein TonB
MTHSRTPFASLCSALAGLCVMSVVPAEAQTVSVSTAENAKAYRMDAARHIYSSYAGEIYKGKLPPLVHAIVVLEVDVAEDGKVRDILMIRVPTHAPDVVARVRSMIQKVGPMPVPARLRGGVKFTEIWLVDKSGRFQLDALTEGQL